MRPAGKGPLDSLYFSYPIFGASACPNSTAWPRGTQS